MNHPFSLFTCVYLKAIFPLYYKIRIPTPLSKYDLLKLPNLSLMGSKKLFSQQKMIYVSTTQAWVILLLIMVEHLNTTHRFLVSRCFKMWFALLRKISTQQMDLTKIRNINRPCEFFLHQCSEATHQQKPQSPL